MAPRNPLRRLRRKLSPYIGRAQAFYAISRIFPVRRRVLVLSDSRATLSGNLAYLVEELRTAAPELEVRTVLRASLKSARQRGDAFRLPWLIATSKFILLDDYYPYIYQLPMRRGVHLIQVWHAAGAFKRVGYSRVGLPGGPGPRSISHRGYTDTITSSESIRGDYAEAFRMQLEDVHALGVPRTDVFFDEGLAARTAAAVRERYGIRPEQRVVLYAPTFRGNGQRTARFDFELIDWDALAAALGDDTVMLVKMHPFVRRVPDIFAGHPQLVDVSAEREINDMLFAADVLVTDYSSVIFEYALLRRPIVFHVPDLEEYQGSRDFYYPFDRYLCGTTTRSTAELAAALTEPRLDRERLDEFVRYFMSACDGGSTGRVVRRLILDRLDEPASARPPARWSKEVLAAAAAADDDPAAMREEDA
ncbi:MAG: CDP-glycerol glycerophosphotransferase family protein [Microbacteriaceae bacterium]